MSGVAGERETEMGRELQLKNPETLQIPNASSRKKWWSRAASRAGFSEVRPCRAFAGVGANARAISTALGPRWNRTTFFTSTDWQQVPSTLSSQDISFLLLFCFSPHHPPC